MSNPAVWADALKQARADYAVAIARRAALRKEHEETLDQLRKLAAAINACEHWLGEPETDFSELRRELYGEQQALRRARLKEERQARVRQATGPKLSKVMGCP